MLCYVCLCGGFFFLGIEARGFIFGPPIALAIGAKFVPLRKPRKLPGTFFQKFFLLALYFCLPSAFTQRAVLKYGFC